MVCEHLRPLEQVLLARGIAETFRGAAWSMNCREWVYFSCHIDVEAVQKNLVLPACVKAHSHRGTHDGPEKGFVCDTCKDGIMGFYEAKDGIVNFKGFAGLREEKAD
jgi:hypothetical protein